jgi:hypothetical protein
MEYKCVIAPVGSPTQEQEVIVEAENKGEALLVNCRLHPGTYVKTIEEVPSTI